MKYIIVAYDRNRVIGKDNTLPWAGKMKTDMKRFKELTTGSAVVMGRKTYESIGRPLPNRKNIIVSRSGFMAPGALTVSSLEDAYNAVEPGNNIYILGGGQLFESALESTDEILATEIDAEVSNGDVFFPALGDEWSEISRDHHEADEENIYPYDFVLFKRR